MAAMIGSNEGPAGSPLSAEQWQTLGRLADRYQRIEEAGQFIAREFGGSLTSGTLTLAELVQHPNFIRNLRELNQTLEVLVTTGWLGRLREFLHFAAESADYLDSDRMMAGLVRVMGRLPLKASEVTGAPPMRKPPAGGWRNLLRLLRDPQVQRGLEVLARLSQQLAGAGK